MASPAPEKKNPFLKNRSLKSWVIETIISFTLVSLAGLGVALIDIYSRQIPFATATLRILGDAFGAGGLVCFSLWMLVWLSGEGAFDIIVYGVRKVFNVTFQNLMKNSTLPDSYFDYVAMRRAKKQNHHFPFGSVSFLFFVIGLVLSVCSL